MLRRLSRINITLVTVVQINCVQCKLVASGKEASGLERTLEKDTPEAK